MGSAAICGRSWRERWPRRLPLCDVICMRVWHREGAGIQALPCTCRYIHCQLQVHTLPLAGIYIASCRYIHCHLQVYTLPVAGTYIATCSRPVASQPGGGGSELGWVEHQAHPPLGHCPRDVINLKNAPTLGHSQAPPPLDIARVTSSTYSKGGTKLLKGGTKLLKGGTKLLKGGTKSLGWATGGGRTTPPTPPPWLRACAGIYIASCRYMHCQLQVRALPVAGTCIASCRYGHYQLQVHALLVAGTGITSCRYMHWTIKHLHSFIS